ncbi:hypothetical protein [Rugamonas sp.]|uniref:hypothetical protein n=1 Tax=Rugamonas sp. TaxID=1926287 RepID=UPI0025FBBE7F|nr:hypothetical protein [Rugamonas sp.]
MTHYSTPAKLLTWTSTPWDGRRPLRVKPMVPGTAGLHSLVSTVRQFSVLRCIEWANNCLGLAKRATVQRTAGLSVAAVAADTRDLSGGCAACRGAHFEIGAISCGQEYL